MASQWGTERIYTTVAEKDSPEKEMCPKCKVIAVPRGINTTRYGVPGEKHCPNCGHIYGRDNH